MLELDLKYLENHLKPVAKWGQQEPHEWVEAYLIECWLWNDAPSSISGIFVLAKTIKRDIPGKPNKQTNETIHPSVMQRHSHPDLQSVVKAYPELVWELQPLERQFKAFWETKYNSESSGAQEYAAQLAKDHVRDSGFWGVGSRISRFFTVKETRVWSRNYKPFKETNRVVSTGLPAAETRLPIPWISFDT